MKKIIALLMVAAMSTAVLTACSGSTEGSSSDADTKTTSGSTSDWSYIENKGEMVIGVTYFEPMNYKDSNGELTGFETEFAQAVCKKLGVKATFQKIDWDSKEVELNSKTIDCIWNGLTINDERKTNMGISTPYMENKQVMVTKEGSEDKYKTAEGLNFFMKIARI